MKTAIYTRISLDPNGEKLGVQRQLDDCLELADRLGWEVVACYDDNDLSAFNGKTRPGFEAMLTAMTSREVGALICWHPDRLYRSMKDLERIIEVSDGVEIRAVNSGDIDLSTSSGRMVARILGSVAQQESEHKGERQKRANAQKAAAGKWQTVHRPFGYTMTGEPLEPEATMIRQAVKDVLGGKSVNQVAREWNATGITTTLAGKQYADPHSKKLITVSGKWNSPRVRRLLVNPRYAGLKVHQGRVVGPGNWEPLIDVDTHRGLVAFLSDPSRITNVSFEKKHMGSGVYRCGVCGGPMRASQPGGKKKGGRRYECRENLCVVRIGAPLDEAVERVLIAWVVKNRHKLMLKRDAAAVDVADLTAQREALEARQDELVDMFTAGSIDNRRLERGTAHLNTQILAIDNTLGALKLRSPLADLANAGETMQETQQYWDDMSPDVRGKVIQEAGAVVVNPAPRGRGFNPEFIAINWKVGT